MDFNEDIALIKDVLTNGLSHIKPKPKIWIEVNERGSGLRMWVISRGFAKMLLHDRYDLVFSLFDQKLNRETEKKNHEPFDLYSQRDALRDALGET